MDHQKIFESIVSYAQSLNQWDLLVIGGSAAILLREAHKRPETWRARWSYFLFLPGWVCQAVSMYHGGNIQRTYVAFMLTKDPNWDVFMEKTNHLASQQLDYFYAGLSCFGIWLATYLVWWVTAKADEIRSAK